jgi:dipeptidyl aminopeptidase/acylaminoacyl peptidase
MPQRQISSYLFIVSTILWGTTPLPAETSPPKHRKFPPLTAPSSIGDREKSGTITEIPNTPHPKASHEKDTVHPMGEGNLKSPTPPENCAHSIEAFIQIASASAPQNGVKGVYFMSDMRETPQVFFLNKPGAWPEQISFFSDGVSYYKVSPDGTKLLLATQEGGNEQYQIYLKEAKGKLTPLLTDKNTRIESVAWSQDSKWFAYTANTRNGIDMDLYRFDLGTKTNEKLADLSGHNTVTDIFGNKIALTTFRSVTDSDVFIFDAQEKKAQPLTQSAGEAYNEGGSFTADGKSLLLISDREKGMPQLFIQDLSRQKTAKLLTSEIYPVEDFSLSKNRKELAYLVNQQGYSSLIWLELDSQGNKKKIHAFPHSKKTVISDPTFSSVGFFYSETSTTRTSDVWFWNGQTKTRWTRSAELRNECFRGEELVTYPSFDGTNIPAFLFRAQNEGGAAPFILFIHGGPESQYRPSFSRIFQYFLQRGFGVFAPNIRGSIGFGRRYTLLDNYKKRMDSIEDVVHAAKWLIQKGYTTPKKLAIYGGSYGGFAVLRTIEVAPELFAAASESVGISNFVTFLKNTKPYRRALREVEYGPLSDEEFLKSISPIHFLDKIKTPLMIFHGANDPRVPVSETEQILKELKARDIEVDHKIFLNEGHGNKKLGNQMEQARLMAHFFEKQLSVKEKGP